MNGSDTREHTTLETIPPPKILEITTAEGVKEYFSFADPVLEVDWGVKGVPEAYAPEYISSHPNETQIFAIRNEQNEIIAGGKVTNLTENMKTILELNKSVFASQKGVLLEYAVVREDKRRQKLLQILTDKRVEWAKQHDAQYVCTEIGLTNPISAYAKAKDGFVFIRVLESGTGIMEPYLVAVKSISDVGALSLESRFPVNQFEQKELLVTRDSKEELASLFSNGWIGVDVIKPTSDTSPWTLVLKKKK